MQNENDNLFNKKMGRILNFQLQIESFEDNTGENIPLSHQIDKEISDLRKAKNDLNDEEKNARANEILNHFEELFDLIGRDRFIFYDDGKIEYIWDMELLEKRKHEKNKEIK